MPASASRIDPLPTLYVHPDSSSSLSVMTFAAEAKVALDCRVIDLFAGEQAGPDFDGFSHRQPVPVLVDGDLRLTEASAILRYLADRAGLPTQHTTCASSGNRRSP
jgi:glutathione S-transferase